MLSDRPEGRIPAVPGRRRATEGGVALTASAEDGLSLDGEPFTGDAVLAAEEAPPARSRIAAARDVRITVIRREGEWAVRVFDPASAARRAFAGIEATAYDPDFVLPGRFRPYGEDRIVQVANADGRARGFGLGGELSFAYRGAEHTPPGRRRRGRRQPLGRDGRCHRRELRLPLPLPQAGSSGSGGRLDRRRLQPDRAAALRLRGPLHLPVPATWEHPALRGRGGRAEAERCPCRPNLTPRHSRQRLPGACQGHDEILCARRTPGCASRAPAPPTVRRAPDPSREDEK